jgi:hypothetical protein
MKSRYIGNPKGHGERERGEGETQGQTTSIDYIQEAWLSKEETNTPLTRVGGEKHERTFISRKEKTTKKYVREKESTPVGRLSHPKYSEMSRKESCTHTP